MTPSEKIIEDSIQTGILKALGCTFSPESDDFGHIQFRVTGDIDGCLEKLYRNHPVGSMDVMQSIKAARQAIFSLRKGKGKTYGNSTRY
jgi:hypothetical protein